MAQTVCGDSSEANQLNGSQLSVNAEPSKEMMESLTRPAVGWSRICKLGREKDECHFQN
jgi:hypothetical protein